MLIDYIKLLSNLNIGQHLLVEQFLGRFDVT